MTKRTIVTLGALAIALTVVSGEARAVNPTGIDPEHYQCYRPTAPVQFTQRTVRLRDQFGTASVRVVSVALICAPVSKNGELLADKASHLVCYNELDGLTPNRRVETNNQFGRLQFTVGKAVMLCVPSTKRLVLQ